MFLLPLERTNFVPTEKISFTYLKNDQVKKFLQLPQKTIFQTKNCLYLSGKLIANQKHWPVFINEAVSFFHILKYFFHTYVQEHYHICFFVLPKDRDTLQELFLKLFFGF